MTGAAVASQAWLESFVPRLVLGIGDRIAPGGHLTTRTEGVVLMADIIGFTPTTAELSAQGRRGQAELSVMLDRSVARVADETRRCGGDVVSYAGDAVISVFSGADAWDVAQQCAERILPGGNMRVGLAAGEVSLLVMRLRSRAYSVLLGPPAVEAARAQAGARSGGVGVHDAGVGVGGAPPVVPGDSAGAGDRVELVRAFVPPPVLARHDAGHSEWLAEIRPITKLFVGLRAGEHPVGDPEQLVAAVEVVDAVLGDHGIALDALVYDDKGMTLTATIGARADSLAELRLDRAVLSGIALGPALRTSGVESDIGIATGQAIVGTFGQDSGRVFTVIGPRVNLAARLMQSAAGRVLVDDETAQRCREPFAFEELPLQLKGIDEPVIARIAHPPAARLRPAAPVRRAAVVPDVPIVDRTDELAAIIDAFQQMDHGRRPVAPVAVIGEPGIGKTALLDAAAPPLERDAGLRIAAIRGDPIARDYPFRPLAPLLDSSDRELREIVAAESGAGAVLRAEDPEPAAVGVVSAALRDRLADGPTVLTIRDAQWVDAGTLAALEHAVAVPDGLRLLLECRRDDARPDSALGQFLGRTAAVRIELAGMEREYVHALAARWLGVKALSDDLVAVLSERAQGNPFFVQQLALTLPEHGLVRRGDVAQLLSAPSVESSFDVPVTIHDVLASRIDALDPDAMLALKAASVLGLSFTFDALAAVHPRALSAAELSASLATLQRDGLVEPASTEASADHGYRFAHALYREVTYSLLTQPQRVAAHVAAAEWIERRGGSEDAVELLAHHWTQADVAERAVPYLSEAARRSAELWPGRNAIDLVLTAKQLAERDGLAIDALQRAGWDIVLGEAYRGAGELDRGNASLAAAVRGLGLAFPETTLSRGVALGRAIGSQAWTRVAPGARVGRLASERERALLARAAFEELFTAAFVEDDLLQMALVNLRILNLTEAAGLADLLPGQYAMAQLAAASGGARRIAQMYGRLAERAIPGGSEMSVAQTNVYGANVLLGDGDFDGARRRLVEAKRFFEAIHGSYIYDILDSLIGWADYFAGRLGDALASYRDVYASGVKRGDPGMVAWGLNGQALCALARGEDELALECLEGSRELPMAYIARTAWHSFSAVAHARLGSHDEAWAQLRSAEPLVLRRGSSVVFMSVHYECTAEAALILRARRWGTPADQEAIARLHRRVLTRASGLRHRLRTAQPGYLVARGDELALRGEPRGAALRYRRALDWAARLGMELHSGLAQARLDRLRHRTGGTRDD